MLPNRLHPHIAVIGAGIAGAACASALRQAGLDVTVFDKSRGVGGRMSTRRATWTGADGQEVTAEFDHGAQHFGARRPRFKAMLQRAIKAGVVSEWRACVHSTAPGALHRHNHVAVPNMPALARHLLADAPLRLHGTVLRLQRCVDGWQVVLAGGEVVSGFDHVMLAMPPAQAAVLLAGHHDGWADALSAIDMVPCWTLMAATDDVDWPWDAAVPARGPLGWIARNDRKPGRSAPAGIATWVAHATAEWSALHADAEPQQVLAAMTQALSGSLPRPADGQPRVWHHASVHRWRYASPAAAAPDAREFWWDDAHGLGVCGDFLAGGDVEGAWRSGDELADTVVAWLEGAADEAAPPPVVVVPRSAPTGHRRRWAAA